MPLEPPPKTKDPAIEHLWEFRLGLAENAALAAQSGIEVYNDAFFLYCAFCGIDDMACRDRYGDWSDNEAGKMVKAAYQDYYDLFRWEQYSSIGYKNLIEERKLQIIALHEGYLERQRRLRADRETVGPITSKHKREYYTISLAT